MICLAEVDAWSFCTYSGGMKPRDMSRSEVISPRLLNYEQAAQYIGISSIALYRHARDGEVSAVRLGRSVRFDRHELDRFIDQLAAEQAR